MSLVLLIFAAFTIAGLDQWSKRAVQNHAFCNSTVGRRAIQIRPVRSRRMTIRQVGAKALLVGVWMSACFAAFALYRFGAWFQTPGEVIGLGVALGGAAGNLIDILRRDYVLDFIDVRGWPVFNLADVGIVVGLPAA